VSRLLLLFNRLLSAVVIATGVALVGIGLVSYGAPLPTDPPVEVTVPTPATSPGGAGPGSTLIGIETPAPTAASSAPSATASGSPLLPSASPIGPSVTPTASIGGFTPSLAPSASATASPTAVPSQASRIVVPSLDIDLAILPGDDKYPLCDVAQFLGSYRQPGEPGTVYIYAHARSGMFLPLLEASERNDGRGMLRASVYVYTKDGHRYLYEIFRVKRHAVDLAIADEVEPGEQRLVMQTSEGPAGHRPKLQVAARFVAVSRASVEESNPKPAPAVCS
jgi:hypothetical protein